jgi:hypothetical protein
MSSVYRDAIVAEHAADLSDVTVESCLYALGQGNLQDVVALNAVQVQSRSFNLRVRTWHRPMPFNALT